MYKLVLTVFVVAIAGSHANLAPLYAGLLNIVDHGIILVNEGSNVFDNIKEESVLAVDLIKHAAEEKDCAKNVSAEVEAYGNEILEELESCINSKINCVNDLIKEVVGEHIMYGELDHSLTDCVDNPLIPCLDMHAFALSSVTDKVLDILGDLGYAIASLMNTILVCVIDAEFFHNYFIIHAVHEAHACTDPEVVVP